VVRGHLGVVSRPFAHVALIHLLITVALSFSPSVPRFGASQLINGFELMKIWATNLRVLALPLGAGYGWQAM
jgi:hypothetical protein